MFAQNKNNKKKRRVHYQLSYQVNIPSEARNQKYRNIKQNNPNLVSVEVLSCHYVQVSEIVRYHHIVVVV